MEHGDPPPAPAPPPAGDSGSAEEPAAPLLPTPAIVALLSLSGVLGAALLANWDKVFGGHHARPANVAAATPGASTSGAAAPDLQRLHGVWLSPLSVHPYQTDRRFRLRLVLNVVGSEVSGQVSDVPEGRETGAVFELVSPRPVGDGLDFEISSTWCCEDGKERPYQVFYQLRPTSQGLAVTRRNNVPGGGKVERFLLERIG